MSVTEPLTARVVVPGGVRSGIVSGPGDASKHGDGPRVLVCSALGLGHYADLVRAAAVVCEAAETTSHMAVVARILGVPVVAVSGAVALLRPGANVSVDSEAGLVYPAPSIPKDRARPAVVALPPSGIDYQVSIIPWPGIVERINRSRGRQPARLFLRSEFVWIANATYPIDLLDSRGAGAVVETLVTELRPVLSAMPKNQILNFRGLDIRSDQTHEFGASVSTAEANPQLGVHGARMLLRQPEYLLSELSAIAQLRSEGFRNLEYSLPFVTLAEEFAEARDLAESRGLGDVPLGLFVETPACVSELSAILEAGPVAAVYVGTKDLTQLVLGADRDNPELRGLLKLTQRPVLHAVGTAVRDAASAGVNCFVFAFADDLPALLSAVPEVSGVSLTGSEYISQVS